MREKLTMTLHFDYNELMGDLDKDRYLSEEEREVIGKIVESILNQNNSVKRVDWKIEEKREFKTEEYCLNNKMGCSSLSSHMRNNYDYKHLQKIQLNNKKNVKREKE